MLLSSCHSACERACRGKETIKPWNASLPSLPDTFLFQWGFFSTLSRQQQEEADGEGHLNKPSVEAGTQDGQAQPDLWPSTPLFPHRGPSLELLDVSDLVSITFVTSVYFSFLSLSCPTFPFLLFFNVPSIFSHPRFLYLGISFSLSPPPFLPDILASCSSRQGVYSCLCEAELQLQR